MRKVKYPARVGENAYHDFWTMFSFTKTDAVQHYNFNARGLFL